MTENSVITLNRTDTTLDLSQKAREDTETLVRIFYLKEKTALNLEKK